MDNILWYGDNLEILRKHIADESVDLIYLDPPFNSKRVLVQVKSGHVNASVIRDLVGTLDREKAEMGLLITLEEPTEPMRREAVTAGYYHAPGWNKDYPRVQILSIERLLHGDSLHMPPYNVTFKRAERMEGETGAGQHQIEWQG